jgi:hypothetical protein
MVLLVLYLCIWIVGSIVAYVILVVQLMKYISAKFQTDEADLKENTPKISSNSYLNKFIIPERLLNRHLEYQN